MEMGSVTQVVRREPARTGSSLPVERTIATESLKAESGCLPKSEGLWVIDIYPLDGTYPHGRGIIVVLFGALMAWVPV